MMTVRVGGNGIRRAATSYARRRRSGKGEASLTRMRSIGCDEGHPWERTRHARPCSSTVADDAFVAIDFETADHGPDSACAVGLVRVEGLTVVRRETVLLRPPRRHIIFTAIHGITWEMVEDKPPFVAAWPQLLDLDGGRFSRPTTPRSIVVCLALLRSGRLADADALLPLHGATGPPTLGAEAERSGLRLPAARHWPQASRCRLRCRGLRANRDRGPRRPVAEALADEASH